MSVPVTVLLYAGIPLGIIAVMAAAVFLPSEVKSPTRYRPGRPWPHQPSWYLPHEISAEPAPMSSGEAHAAVESAHAHAAVGTAPAAVIPAPAKVKAAGGASGEW